MCQARRTKPPRSTPMDHPSRAHGPAMTIPCCPPTSSPPRASTPTSGAPPSLSPTPAFAPTHLQVLLRPHSFCRCSQILWVPCLFLGVDPTITISGTYSNYTSSGPTMPPPLPGVPASPCAHMLWVFWVHHSSASRTTSCPTTSSKDTSRLVPLYPLIG